jgi:hypothetical protein
VPPLLVLSLALWPAPRAALGAQQVQPQATPLPAKLDESVARGLAYLAKQQNADGSVSAGLNPDGTPGPAGGPPLAMTGLALMAFLAAGHAPDVGRHGLVVASAVDHLLDRIPDSGYVGAVTGERGDTSRMYGQAIVTLALAESYGVERDPDRRLRTYAALNKLVAVILTAQAVAKPEPHAGGWRYTPDAADSDLSVSGWNALALRACQDAGLNVPADAVARAVQFVVKCQNAADKGFAYQPGGPSAVGPTAVGILSLYLLDAEDHPGLIDAQKFFVQVGVQPITRFSYYTAYHGMQAALQAGEPTWGTLSRVAFDGLIPLQLPDGGWPPSPTPEEPGRVYSTAMAVLALSVPYRLLPIYQR